jgi:uncharacterized protein (TIGR02266 family)
MSSIDPRQSSMAPELDLDTVEHELAEAELSLEARMQMAMRQSETVLGRVRLLLEAVQRSGVAADDPVLRGRLEALATPALDLTKPLAEARAARKTAVVARQKAHDFIESAIDSTTKRFSTISGELGALEKQVQAGITAAQKAREAYLAHGGTAAPDAPPPRPPPRQPAHAVTPPPPPPEPQAAAPRPAAVPPPAPSGAERRQDTRVRLERTVDLHSDDNFFVGFANDISVGGLFVATHDALPRGATIELVFTLPDGTRVEAEGEVRWTREYNDRVPFEFPGIGIQFKRIAKEHVEAIGRFVSQRDAIFYDD